MPECLFSLNIAIPIKLHVINPDLPSCEASHWFFYMLRNVWVLHLLHSASTYVGAALRLAVGLE